MPPQPRTFSVVIATYNRPARLTACLAALSVQDFPRERFEVVVVDDGGDADLAGPVERFAESLDIRLLRKDNGGPASARNLGVEHANGHFIAFTDDDCEPDTGWLAGLERRFGEYSEAMIGGKTLNRLQDRLFSEASQAVIDLVYQHYNAEPNRARFLATNNMALPRQRFLELGGFDLSFFAGASEDRELCERWLEHGLQIIYDPDLTVYHSHEQGPLSFFQLHFRYGRGAWCFRRLQGRKGLRAFGRDASWQLGLGTWLFYPFRAGCKKPVPMMLALVYWQVANLSGFLYEAVFGDP